MFTAEDTCVLVLLLIAGQVVSKGVSSPTPPPPRFSGGSAKTIPVEMGQAYNSWTPKTPCNIWELSGQHEGDIMIERGRNAVSDPTRLWPGGVVPYYIDSDDFDKEDKVIIKEAIKEIEDETCIEFRPYKEEDEAYVFIRGNKNGCWSYVGRKSSGQTLNLGEKCVRHGTVVHELLHALGLHHQQSSYNRDEYVTIHWKNIEEEHKHNFEKYNSSAVTDYGVGYDYASIMHYSAYAFSKNDKMTITAKEKNVKIGQRKSLSEKDVLKINKMYNCPKSKSDEEESSEMSNLVDIFGK